MDGHEALAAGDEIEEGLLLLGRELGVVGEDREGVVAGERGGVQVFELLGVGEGDAARAERGVELFEALGGLVVAFVAEEEDVQAVGFCERGLGGGEGGERGEERQREGGGAKGGSDCVFHDDGFGPLRAAGSGERLGRNGAATMRFRGIVEVGNFGEADAETAEKWGGEGFRSGWGRVVQL